MEPHLKVNIVSPISKKEINGYTNIDGLENNVFEILCDGECKEIIAEDVVNFFQLDDAPTFINGLCSKVAVSGTIMISSIELFDIAKDISNRHSLHPEMNLLRSVNEILYCGRKNILSAETITSILVNNNFKILKNRTNGYKTYITAERTK